MLWLPRPQPQAWPTKAVSLIVPSRPGHRPDVLAARWGKSWPRAWASPSSWENKPGAGATLGADFVAKAKPDGYTPADGAVHHTIATSVYRKLAYDFQKDSGPITTVAMVPNVLVVQADAAPAHPHRARADRPGQAGARQAHVWLQRQRHGPAPDWRAV